MMLELKSEEEIYKWLFDNYAESIQFIQDYCSKEDRTNPAYLLYSYGGEGYREYNEVLRLAKGSRDLARNYFNKYSDIETYEEIQILNDFIMKYPLQNDLVLYRFEKLDFKELIKLIKKPFGSTVVDYGFISTTLLPDSSGMNELRKNKKYNVMYKLFVPKGVPAIPVQFRSDQTMLKEFEMLFPLGIEKKMIRKRFNINQRIIMFEFEILEWI